MSVNQIFSFDSSGVNSVVMKKVRAHGMVADKTYSLWMDDGEGGPSASVKTPTKPYTQGDCAHVMFNRIRQRTLQTLLAVSRGYANEIRRGRAPHPRHWWALASLMGVSGLKA
jgi:hypothetical protein